MVPKLFEAVTNAAINATTLTLRSHGAVQPPILHVVRDDRLIGYVSMRPAYRGNDGVLAVTEMSTFAASARATEVILSWEQMDLAVLAGAASGSHPCAVHVCLASPQGHVLSTLPFRPIVTPRRRRTTVDVQWEPAIRNQPNAPLPPLITNVIQTCWQPMEGSGVDEHAAAVYLRSQGYTVELGA